MKWIELKNGIMVNLENISFIVTVDKKGIEFFDASDEPCSEVFDTEEEAKKRMEELKKVLL